jgi:hypothetical protein
MTDMSGSEHFPEACADTTNNPNCGRRIEQRIMRKSLNRDA